MSEKSEKSKSLKPKSRCVTLSKWKILIIASLALFSLVVPFVALFVMPKLHEKRNRKGFGENRDEGPISVDRIMASPIDVSHRYLLRIYGGVLLLMVVRCGFSRSRFFRMVCLLR